MHLVLWSLPQYDGWALTRWHIFSDEQAIKIAKSRLRTQICNPTNHHWLEVVREDPPGRRHHVTFGKMKTGRRSQSVRHARANSRL